MKMLGYYGKQLIKEYAEVVESFYYVADGDVIVGKKDLAKILKVAVNTIDKYEKKGLERWEGSPNRTPMYKIVYAIGWYANNVDTKHRQTSSVVDDELDVSLDALIEQYKQFENVETRYLPADELDRQEKVRKALVSKGQLKTIDELQATAVDVFTSAIFFLKNVSNSIPQQFANSSKEKLTIGINELFKDAINSVRERFKKEVNSDMVEIFNRVMELKEDGRDVMELLNGEN